MVFIVGFFGFWFWFAAGATALAKLSRFVIGFCPRLLFMFVSVNPASRNGRTWVVSAFRFPLSEFKMVKSPGAYSVEKKR